MAPESELLKDESENFLEENFQPQDLLPKEETQYIIILAVLLVLGKEEGTQYIIILAVLLVLGKEEETQ